MGSETNRLNCPWTSVWVKVSARTYMPAASELVFKTAAELGSLIRRKRVSPVEVTSAFLDRIDALNPRLNAFITITREHAMERARKAETEIQKGRYLGPLHGIVYAAKDCFATKGILTTNGSRLYEKWIPDFESTATERLNNAGAILLGKLNLWELASAGFALETVRNPWSLEHAAGGSSSGSGAAPAARMVPLALGTDTGGSVRTPAALCGITGLRPTYGRVSLHGIIVNTWSVDTAGPMTATVEDNAIMLRVIAGADGKDRTASSELVPDYGRELKRDMRGMRVGVPKEHFFEVAPDVEAGVRAAIAVLAKLGAVLVEVDIPHAPLAATVRNILFAESVCYHEKRLREGAALMGSAARERLEAAAFITATDYIKAQRIRTILMREVQDVFQKCDVFIAPTLPNTASLLSEGLTTSRHSPRPLNSGGALVSSVTGIPSLAVPCGFSATRPALPFSMLIHAAPFREGVAFRAGHAYQSATDWHKRVPGTRALRLCRKE